MDVLEWCITVLYVANIIDVGKNMETRVLRQQWTLRFTLVEAHVKGIKENIVAGII